MSSERTPAALTSLESDYEILEEIGRGGTAIVYRARSRATGAEVAIKLIRAKYLEDDEALARFAREARFVAQLDHPHVVGVHAVLDLGSAGIALVMSHVAGRTLKQVIKEEHPLSADRVTHIMRDVATALAAAHRMGIVHRDVKPENIFIDQEGRALLADFGVARSMSGDTQLTMHGVAIGTPSYMAPEQIDGGELDGRGDIYSLGLVAWEMFTGHRPWEGESLYAVLYHQRHHELPDVREMRADVPDQMADVIAGAIEKEPSARWQSMEELIAALDGAAPSRRAKAHVPVSTDTVQFVRPLTPAPSAPAVSIVPATTEPETPAPSTATPAATPALAPLSVGSYFEPGELDDAPPARRFSLSKRQTAVIAAALVAVVSLGVVATVAGNARGDRERAVTTRTAAGEVGRNANRVAPAHPDSVVRSALPMPESLSVAAAIGLAAPASPTSLPVATATGAAAQGAPDARVGVTLDAQKPAVPAGATAKSSSAPAVVSVPKSSPSPTPVQPPPTAVPPSISVAEAIGPPPSPRPRVSIVAGGLHTCMISADGRAYCWGGNDRGQLGAGAEARSSTPTLVGNDLRFVSLAPGLAHSCGIARGGALWCWGENDHGQLGDRTTSARSSPVHSASGHAFRSIATGAAHTCGIEIDGDAWCWGADSHGQLGDAGSSDRVSPVAVAGGKRFSSLDVGWNFTCGVAEDRRAMCWGDNGSGQLGDGTTIDRRVPTAVQGNVEFKSITAGNAHACGITDRGEAYCWGRNASGELGDGSTSSRATPVRVRSGERFVSIAAGAVHTCAVAEDGEAWCWGRNTYGQLGNGGTSDATQPVRVTGGHIFTSVRAFGSHTCGSTASGEAFCWGYNSDGQLGDGTRTSRTRPVYVEPPGG